MYLQAIVQFTIAFRSGKIESTFGDFHNIKREQQIQFKDMNETRRTIGSLALPALLLTLLLLFVSQTECRAAGESENESDIASLPPDVDNVELHRVKLVNGVMTEDHPFVMYKEDFVNEDYDPTQSETKAKPTRKYKQLKRMVRFDVLPETPIFVDGADDFGADNFEAGSLLEPSKQETLQKYPKKYHSRQRRQAYYNFSRNNHDVQPSQNRGDSVSNSLSFGHPNLNPRNPVEDKEPKNHGNRLLMQPPRREPSPQRRPATNRPTTSAPAASRRNTPRVSSCVWAIVNCCSQGNSEIHYNCFEEFDCHGAFWGVNPCADNVRDGTIVSLTRSFSTGPPSQRQYLPI
ncbi:uncharacterized protein LOC117573894 isoform X7 [Drosophila albomicans]|uniref:Uncharacterized protein LOC117573894 isoform X7 n=2 Tax=Drosophila albomicans TaxID=7291 RepID=A0A9C6TAT5_DROAB|nr:uncharacterized protein LOC117573894 isoform X7 [Drosophila albomicans]